MGLIDRLLHVGNAGVQALSTFTESLTKATTGGENRSLESDQDTTPGGRSEDTSADNPVPTEPAAADPKSLFFDPFAIIEQLGYKEKPSQVTYGTLKTMVWRMPIIQAIVQTRVNQVASFAQPVRDRYQLGFQLKLRGEDRAPTGVDRRWAQQMETLLMRTGATTNPQGRDTFEAFLKKLCWDSLVYDQACFEVVPDRRGRPCEWYAVDGTSIRLADAARTFLDENLLEETRYVQIYDGMIVSEYKTRELCFGVRNPRTDMRLHGYGVSELEMLIAAITSLLYAWDYNSKFFSQGSAVKGLLNVKGTVPEGQLRAFRQQWYKMVSGIENAWRTPIINTDDVQWVSMQMSSRDMEFSAWMDFLLKVACSMYLMDPIEVNFKYGTTGQRAAMSEANNKEKITESKERGLRPLLRFFERCVNQHIIWPLNEAFEFAFTGLDAMTRENVADWNQKRVRVYRTVDELRAEDGLEPLPDKKGEIILDPTWLQWAQVQQQAAQQPASPNAPVPGDGELPAEDQPNPDFGQEAAYTAGEQTPGAEPDQGAPLGKSWRRRPLVIDLKL